MPKPIPGQSQDDFISECIPKVIADGTADTQDQAIAVCYSMWEESKQEIKDLLDNEN